MEVGDYCEFLANPILFLLPRYSGIVMFLSFATFGAFPILGYVVFPGLFPEASSEQLFGAACGVTGVVLFFLGSLKSKFGSVCLVLSALSWFTLISLSSMSFFNTELTTGSRVGLKLCCWEELARRLHSA